MNAQIEKPKTEAEIAADDLREIVKPGDTVFTILRHVSRSGMLRAIDCYVYRDNEPRRITWSVAKACGFTYSRRHEALTVGGCGMDMGFHVVYTLGRVLFTGVKKERHADSGYALNQRWQ